jgi:GTP-binding protein
MKRNMVISLIGRPNVGKSSIFNRLMRRQNKALTHDEPGVTRDRHYGIARISVPREDESKEVILVDTGGFYPEKIEENEKNHDKFFNIMTDHAHMAIDESDLVLFVCDVREGALPFDSMIADYIRTQKKKFWVLVNKYDSDKQAGEEVDFYQLGVDSDELFVMSAAHGRGFDDLYERLYSVISDFENKAMTTPNLQKGVTPREKVAAKVALIGAPNAGKSTLLNVLVGAERALVSGIAGTTVDPIEGYFDLYFGKDVKFIDEKTSLVKQDQLLVEQYEEFRANNPDVFTEMLEAYHEEEEEVLSSVEYASDFNLLEGKEEEVLIAEKTEEAFAEAEVISEAFSEEESEGLTEEKLGSLWRSIHLVDTAGIRKQANVRGFIEEQSVYRSLRCITESDVILFMVDVTKGVAHQDRRLIDIALEKGKSVILLLNKMDLIKDKFKTERERKEWMLDLRAKIPWLDFCDICPISAKKNRGISKLKKLLKKTILIRKRPVPTGELNRFVFDLVERNPIVVKKSGGRRFKVKYTSMVKTAPPTFLFFSNRSKGIPENYKRYLKNHLRGYFGLDNTPIHLLFRTGKDLAMKDKNALK